MKLHLDTAFHHKRSNLKNAFGVYMNPDKSKMVTFSPEDFIIVLAED
jgi:hypothetical protein